MITRLRLRNFRAFKQQPFVFSRLNIFVGPNNSGKSSAISALNLIAQTFHTNEFSQSPLIINGQFDQLGTYKDIVYKNRASTPMGIDIGFDAFELRLEFKYRTQRREIEIVKYELYEKGEQLIFYHAKKDSFTFKFGGTDIEKIFPKIRKRRPKFSGFFPDRTTYDPIFLARREDRDSESVQYIRWRDIERRINFARRDFRRNFNLFDSLGPFRDKPERTYLYSGETASRIGNTGANTAILLSSDASRRGSESKAMLADISRWFEVTGIAKSIKIHPISPRHFELVLVEKDGSQHNISDVGFGCSQVLPVLAASLNAFAARRAPFDYPIFVVQEPEIHLHPNAQAALGSFFAGVLPARGQLFIETHSDNLILRVAQHVADGKLDCDDVRIFYVAKKDGASRVTSLELNPDGSLGRNWPDGFFPQRQSESLALAKAISRKGEKPEGNRQMRFSYPEDAK
mgnify:CR=1 FL=1|tara:strand:- start:911 stop:2284 length:1374 start_codon:yes stop_codon:yes gene_type:complete